MTTPPQPSTSWGNTHKKGTQVHSPSPDHKTLRHEYVQKEKKKKLDLMITILKYH